MPGTDSVPTPGRQRSGHDGSGSSGGVQSMTCTCRGRCARPF